MQNLASLCTEQTFVGGIIWCYSEKTTVPSQQLAVLSKRICFYEGVPDNFDNAQGTPTLIYPDDLLNEV
jgi:hypothetical protein